MCGVYLSQHTSGETQVPQCIPQVLQCGPHTAVVAAHLALAALSAPAISVIQTIKTLKTNNLYNMFHRQNNMISLNIRK